MAIGEEWGMCQSKGGSFLADVRQDGGGEKGGEGVGDGKNKYLWLPGPRLMERVDEDGETFHHSALLLILP